MKVRDVNVRALRMAVEATVGKDLLPVIEKLYVVLDKLENDVLAECEESDRVDFVDGYDAGREDGYEAGFEDGSTSVTEEPPYEFKKGSDGVWEVDTIVVHDENLVNAVAALDAPQPYVGDVG